MKNNLFGLIYGIVLLVLSLGESTSAQWLQMSKGAVAPITSLAIIDSQIFAATLNNGIYFSTDNGANWTSINLGLPAPPANNINCLAVNGSNIFAGTSANMVFILPKNGTSWTAIDSNLGGSVLFLAVNGSTVFAGTYGRLFFSTNNGTSWTEDDSGLGNYSVLSFAVKGSTIFIGTNGGGVFTLSNAGTGWANVNSDLSNCYVQCLAVSGNNIFAGVSLAIRSLTSLNNRTAGMASGFYLSSDNCTTWTAVNSGFPTCLDISGANIFAGTTDGLYY